MISEGWQHLLSFAVRFNNHFTGEPIGDELPLRLDRTFLWPVATAGGGYRHADGTYRFINVAGGQHRVRWLLPFEDDHKGWVSWEDDLVVSLPLTDPEDLMNRDLWPHASAVVPPGNTAVRGRLVGANIADLRVQIRHPAIASTRFTRTDENGNFLFLLPQPLATNNTGRLPLRLRVDNGARAVDGGEFIPQASGAAFVGSQFLVLPGKTSRVVIEIT